MSDRIIPHEGKRTCPRESPVGDSEPQEVPGDSVPHPEGSTGMDLEEILRAAYEAQSRLAQIKR